LADILICSRLLTRGKGIGDHEPASRRDEVACEEGHARAAPAARRRAAPLLSEP